MYVFHAVALALLLPYIALEYFGKPSHRFTSASIDAASVPVNAQYSIRASRGTNPSSSIVL